MEWEYSIPIIIKTVCRDVYYLVRVTDKNNLICARPIDEKEVKPKFSLVVIKMIVLTVRILLAETNAL